MVRPLRYALFDDLDMSGESPLLCCARCGMVYNDVCGGAEALARYYAQNAHYLASASAGTGGVTEDELSRYRRLLALLEGHLSADTAILDVGCGKGGLLDFLAGNGYRALWGIEPSMARNAPSGNRGTHSVVPAIDALPSDTRPNLIVLGHVIEHLYAPIDTIRQLVALAADDAVFYIEAPNSQAVSGLQNPYPALYFEHVNHFDLALMHSLAERCGLSVLHSGTHSFLPGTGCANECAYVICQNRNTPGSNSPRTKISDLGESFDELPLISNEIIDKDLLPQLKGRYAALWGVSQYAQLLLGTYPALAAQVDALYDLSPAKQGRSIEGIMIQPPPAFSRLDDDAIILLPQSAFIRTMISELVNSGFRRQYKII